MIISISGWELDITSISSANARRSPLDLTSSNFCDDLMASSRYTLNKIGDSTDPYGSPISASIECSPTWMVDYLCNLVISSTIISSLWFLHLFLSNIHNISLSTESYAFCRSMRRLKVLFLLPCTSFRSLLAWIAVDFPSLNPVWYTLEEIRWGQQFYILASIAFSMILDRWERTTMGLMSSKLTGPLVWVFYSGTSLPSLK